MSNRQFFVILFAAIFSMAGAYAPTPEIGLYLFCIALPLWAYGMALGWTDDDD